MPKQIEEEVTNGKFVSKMRCVEHREQIRYQLQPPGEEGSRLLGCVRVLRKGPSSEGGHREIGAAAYRIKPDHPD
jgi:hypothetical protein